MADSSGQGKRTWARSVSRYLGYTVVWSLFWWLLNEGDTLSWLVGLPTVLAAAGVSVWLAPASAWPWRIRGLLRFLWHFGTASLVGGIDVAWRAVHFRLPIDPEMLEYETRLPEGTPRVFFANVISLCPGTVSAHLCGNQLRIHVLDIQQPVRAQLDVLERAVGALFGAPIPRNEPSGGEVS